MNNFKQQGDTLVLTAPYAVASGAGALIGAIFGIAAIAIANGVKGPFKTNGVFALPKAAGAVTEGAIVYWDNTAKNVTTTASGNTKIGAAVAAQASGDATVTVKLNGTV